MDIQNLEWHECHVDESEMHIEGEVLPEDGAYNYWKFKDGDVCIARMKYDAIDHFYPRIGRDECDIVAWAKIPKENYVQLRYQLQDAVGCLHPTKQMEKLGYKIIACVPQSIADQWWFTVEEIIEPLPHYLERMEYDFEKWHS